MTEGRYRDVFEAFTTNRLSLVGFLKRFLDSPEDVEDLMQETFAKAYEAERAAVIAAPRAFLFRTARNLALNKLGERNRRATDSVENMDRFTSHPGVESTPEQTLIIEREVDLALRILEKLPRRAREVVILRKVHGLRQKQIAKELGLAESTVESHISRAMRLIRSAAGERG